MALRVAKLELTLDLTPEQAGILMAMVQNPVGDPAEETEVEADVRRMIFEPLHEYFRGGKK